MTKIRNNAQASLELAFGLICLMVLVWGTFNIFLWLNKQMLNRQEDYAVTRQQIGDSWSSRESGCDLLGDPISIPVLRPGTESTPVDESNTTRYPKLDVL